MKTTPLALTLALGLLGAEAGAEVRVLVRPDGTTFIYNYGAQEQPPRSVSRQRLWQLIVHHSRRQNLDPELVEAVVQVESGFNPRARSHKGAMGLMQLMPATAKTLGVGNAYDPDENLRGGTLYLRRLMDRFDGDLKLALAGYNAGPGAVEKYNGIPPYRETTNYVKRVLSLYRGDPASASGVRRKGSPVLVRRDRNQRILLTTGD